MNPLIRTSLLAAALITLPALAQARNPALESGLGQLGDISDFYHALVYTGVGNELSPDRTYTVFAPTNAVFAQLGLRGPNCPDEAACREQAARFVRAHIVDGGKPLPRIIRMVQLQSTAGTEIVAQEPFNGQYTVDGQNIMSETDADGNVIYRVGGFLKNDRQGAYQALNFIAPPSLSQSTTMYVVPQAGPLQAQGNPALLPGVNAETTIVKKSVTIEQTPAD